MAKLSTSSVFGDLLVDGTIHGNVTGNLTGNASTATSATTATSAGKWTTARTITIGNTGKSIDGSGNVSWTLAEIGAAASSHKHGLLHDNFTVEVASTTTDNGWSMINSSYNGYLLKSMRFGASVPPWAAGGYGAGIAFGGGDTKGVMSMQYSSPWVKFAGGNGTKPVWNIGITGTSGTNYNLEDLNSLGGQLTLTNGNIGTLSSLKTSAKGNLVAAINEVFQSGNDAKQKLVDALVAYGVNCSTSDTWDTLINHVAPKADSSLFIIKNNILNSTYSFYSVSGTSGSSWKYSTTNGLYTNNSTGSSYEYVTTSQKLNFSKIKSIKITAKCTSTEHASGYKIWATSTVANALNNSSDVSQAAKQSDFVPVGNTYVTRTFDVSSWTGEYYLGITRNSYGGHTFYVKDIEIELSEVSGGLGTLESLMGGGLDIISATSLPDTGKNNQICVITDNPISKFMISSDSTVAGTDQIVLYSNNGTANYSYNVYDITYTFNFYKVIYNGDRLASYYWANNTWNVLTLTFLHLLENGLTPPGTVGSLLTSSTIPYLANEGCIRIPSTTSYYHIISYSEAIDFSEYSKVEIDACSNMSGIGKYVYVGRTTACYTAQAITSNYTSYMSNGNYSNGQYVYATEFTTYTFDISSITGTGYLSFHSGKVGCQLFIKNVRVYP